MCPLRCHIDDVVTGSTLRGSSGRYRVESIRSSLVRYFRVSAVRTVRPWPLLQSWPTLER